MEFYLHNWKERFKKFQRYQSWDDQISMCGYVHPLILVWGGTTSYAIYTIDKRKLNNLIGKERQKQIPLTASPFLSGSGLGLPVESGEFSYLTMNMREWIPQWVPVWVPMRAPVWVWVWVWVLVNIWRFARGWPVNAEAALEMPKNNQMYLCLYLYLLLYLHLYLYLYI